jgi:AcrR family transcriptional regulator
MELYSIGMSDVNPPATSRARASLRQERAAVTRRRIAEAARAQFRARGYAATTITEIAAEAGVAVQTVYAVFGSKAGILDELRVAAMHQPDAEAEYARAMGEPDPRRRLRLFARSIRLRWEHAGDIVAIHRDAASADPGIRAAEAGTLARRRAGLRALAATLDGGLRDGMDVDRATAILDALTLYEVYAALVAAQRWTPGAFEDWLGEALVREVLAG